MTERTRTAWFGVLTVAAGALAAAGIHWHPEQLNAPEWAGYSACLAFVFVGLSVVAEANARPRAAAWLALGFLGALVLAAMWVGFGPGSRECSFWLSSIAGISTDWICRGVFGLGAVIGAGLLLWGASRALRQKYEP